MSNRVARSEAAGIDARIRLADAAAHYDLTVASLRREAKRGRLAIWRVAGKDWTSLAEIERMFDRCRVEPKELDSGCDQLDPDTARYGSSKTADTSAALAAARLRLERLSGNSGNTLPRSENRAARENSAGRARLRSLT